MRNKSILQTIKDKKKFIIPVCAVAVIVGAVSFVVYSHNAKMEQSIMPKKNTSKVQESVLQTDPEEAAYYAVLEQTYDELATYVSDYYDISNLSKNHFSIYDIDQDGKDELIIELTDVTATAAMGLLVYGFDTTSGEVRKQLTAFPLYTFYDNGVVEAKWSHNHGLGPDVVDFWPYRLYKYDKETDTYLLTADVDVWSKACYEKDYNNKPFPDELDADGDAILYKITVGDNEKLIDLEEYKKWRNSMIDGAKKIEIPFVEMTEENIRGKGSSSEK